MSPFNSIAINIRNEVLARIKTLAAFQNVTRFSTAPAPPILSDQLPFLGVYLMEETLSPDGDANAGEPRFIADAKIGFSYIIQNIDPEMAEDILDKAYWAIMTGFLEQQRWQFFADNLQLESVTRGSRKFKFGNTGQTNMTPVAELQADLTFRQRETFPPLVLDDLRTFCTEVYYPWPYDPNAYEPFRACWTLPIQLDWMLGSPFFGRAFIIVTPVVRANAFVLGSPVFGRPALRQNYKLDSISYAVGRPSFATPALSVRLTADTYAVARPSFATPMLRQELAAASYSVARPNFAAPPLAQELEAINYSVASLSFDAPPITVV